MSLVDLPNGKSAVLLTRDEITQRAAMKISQSMMASTAVAMRLTDNGMDPENPLTWGAYTSLNDDDVASLNAYQSELIVAFVKQWDVLSVLPSTENVLDIPQKTFEILAEKCQAEFNNVPEFGPDGATDPLVDTGNSEG
jgi:hypothetical protein